MKKFTFICSVPECTTKIGTDDDWELPSYWYYGPLHDSKKKILLCGRCKKEYERLRLIPEEDREPSRQRWLNDWTKSRTQNHKKDRAN